MQFTDAFCYVLLIITVISTWAQGYNLNRDLSAIYKRINKRDASIILDTMPIESSYVNNEPKIIYKRVSRQKYGNHAYTHKPVYRKPGHKGRSPSKKYRKYPSASSKYGPPRWSQRPGKPRYSSYKRPETSPSYGVPKKVSYFAQYPPQAEEHTGFGEPPSGFSEHQHSEHQYSDHHQRPKKSYGEPPVDSYGTPLQPGVVDASSYSQTYGKNPILSSHFENSDREPYRQEYSPWQNHQSDDDGDNTFAYTKKRPLYSKPDPFEHLEVDEDDTNMPIHSTYHGSIRVHNDDFRNFNEAYHLNRKKKPQYLPDNLRAVKKPWKSIKTRPDDEVLVGGQYAEPPARYVPKFQPSAPMFDNDEDFAPPNGFVEPEVASATISPYVNYKNSNMAFSPQNLNDAFSIVEK